MKAVKIPAINANFWISFILSNFAGLAIAKFLIELSRLGLMFTMLLASAGLVISLAAQISGTRFSTARYWFASSNIAIISSLLSDYALDIRGIPTELQSIILTTLLVTTLGLWFVENQSLAIDNISSMSQETFYWSALFLTLALSRTFFDLAFEDRPLRFNHLFILCAVISLAIYIAHHFKFVGKPTAFWLSSFIVGLLCVGAAEAAGQLSLFVNI